MDAELAIVAGRIDVLLERAQTAQSIAERRYALDALARGLLLADPGSVDPGQRALARDLRVDASTVEAASATRQPHAVDVPFAAAREAIVRQVIVTYDPLGLAIDRGLFGAEAVGAARLAIELASQHVLREYGSAHDPALHRLTAVQPRALAAARIDGASIGAGCFVSAVALFSRRRVLPSVVVTGTVTAQGAILQVGHVRTKVAAAVAHRAKVVVVPLADREAAEAARREIGGAIRVAAVRDVDALLAEVLVDEPAARPTPDADMRVAHGEFARGWRGYRWPSVRESLARLCATLPRGRLDLRVEALARLGATFRHLGDPIGSLEWLREAEGLARSELGRRSVPDAPLSYLWLQYAMTYRQLGRFVDAGVSARRAASIARRARLLRELIKALGTVGLVALSRGRPERAIAAFEESLEVGTRFDPSSSARTRAYLVEACGVAGRSLDAKRHYQAALAELAHGSDDYERAWVKTSYGGALVTLGEDARAIDVLQEQEVQASLVGAPLPGLFARRHLGVAYSRVGDFERGAELLAGSVVVFGRALEPHLAFLAHVNVLCEAYESLRTGRWTSDMAARARRACEHVPRHGELPTFLGRALHRFERSLSGRPSKQALETLLTRCARLS